MELDVPGLALSEPEPGIAELVIDRPERRNALTEEMMRALDTVVAELNATRTAVALLVRGAGGAFCAGADRSVVDQRRQADQPWRWPPLMGREADLLAACEVATIAVVDGPAVGLGMGLALSCDICVVEPAGYFAEAHLALGLAPTAMCWWLPRMAGLQRAGDIILTGRRVYGQEAAAAGLAARLAEPGTGRAVALEVARAIGRQPPEMSRYAKLALRLAQDQSRMTEVRRFGALANRIYRGLPTAEAAGTDQRPRAGPDARV
jgi:enoyl-CoA hydratase/carnithine racemase